VFEWATLPDWAWWGFAIVGLFPVATVLLNETGFGLERKGRDDLSRPVTLLRTACLPLLFIVLLLRFVAQLEPGHLLVRIADTAFWITVINVGLLFFNLAFFSGGASESWRQKTPKLFLDLFRLFMVAVGTAIVISTIWGVDLGGLLTALGVGSIVIGLALQDTLGSLFSGIALLSARHYREGDWLQVGGHEGIVVSMNWRSVSLRTRDGDIMILPNTDMAKQHVRNVTAFQGWHGEFVDLNLSYEHPPEQVKDLILETARATPGVLTTPPPQARLKAFADTAISYQALLFFDDYAKMPVALSEFRSLFWYRAKRAGIAFPAAHHRLFRSPPELRAEQGETCAERAELLIASGAFPKSATNLDTLLADARVERYGKGETLVSPSSSGNDVFVVLEGAAVATVQTASRNAERPGAKASANGNESTRHFHEFGPGQIILFKAMFRNEPSGFDVRSSNGMVVLAIPFEDFSSYLANNPELARDIERIVSQRELAAGTLLKKDFPDAAIQNGSDDRIQLLEQMFRN